MSKLPKNFEKALLGVAGVAAIGFIALGFMKSGAVETDFAHSTATTGKNEPGIPEAEATARAVTSLTTNLSIAEATIQADGKERKVDLFTGIHLYADKVNPNQPIDPVRGRQIFPEIPNEWWIETGADPSYADSPARDDDSDGFSNLEEYLAKTHPKDDKSVPGLIDKLAYVKDESTQWYVVFGFESEGKWSPKAVAITPDKKRLENKVSATAMLAPGDMFFTEKELFKNRFRFVGISKKMVHSTRTNSDEEVNVAEYEDLKPNKKGTTYNSQYGLPENEIPSHAYYDRTAVLELQAIGEKGHDFKVEEGTAFALPQSSTEKKYFMKSISPEAIVVEYTDAAGAKQTATISKGSTGPKPAAP
jgi:hypothetical protein